jgi:hypothetical protein
MSSGTSYHVDLVRTAVSENISPPSSGFLRVKGLHSCVTMEWFLISLSIEGYYVGQRTLSFGMFSQQYLLLENWVFIAHQWIYITIHFQYCCCGSACKICCMLLQSKNYNPWNSLWQQFWTKIWCKEKTLQDLNKIVNIVLHGLVFVVCIREAKMLKNC